MLIPSAENSYRDGRLALEEGRKREALAYFEAALELERRLGESGPQPRYLSFYGLCLGLFHRRLREGIEFCRKATSMEPFDPDLNHNLGRVYMAAGQRKKAREILLKGLRMQPDHAAIRMELGRMGMRKRPAIPFLSRNHPLNVYLGVKRRGKEAPRRQSATRRRTRRRYA